jgi:hypothetical protein
MIPNPAWLVLQETWQTLGRWYRFTALGGLNVTLCAPLIVGHTITGLGPPSLLIQPNPNIRFRQGGVMSGLPYFSGGRT